MPQPRKAPAADLRAEPKPVASIASHAGYDAGVVNSEERIRRRAYELYEQRGRQDGFADQDWLRAESEVRSQKRSA